MFNKTDCRIFCKFACWCVVWFPGNRCLVFPLLYFLLYPGEHRCIERLYRSRLRHISGLREGRNRTCPLFHCLVHRYFVATHERYGNSYWTLLCLGSILCFYLCVSIRSTMRGIHARHAELPYNSSASPPYTNAFSANPVPGRRGSWGRGRAGVGDRLHRVEKQHDGRVRERIREKVPAALHYIGGAMCPLPSPVAL